MAASPLDSRAGPPITSEQAVALAVNDLRAAPDGWALRHPRHRAWFTTAGVRFATPGGVDWRWHLTRVDGGAQLGRLSSATPSPIRESRTAVAYRRGALVERYLFGADSVEQQFVFPRQPRLTDDLVIEGAVESGGRFARTVGGWRWRGRTLEVRLGDVTVFDARGRTLPARMEATATSTRIVVERAALLRASYPVTVDPEIGANDFRISDAGPDGNIALGADSPAVAFNPSANEYMVVWQASELAYGDIEVFGQRIDAGTGTEVGPNDFQISDMGHDPTPNFFAIEPKVAYNSSANEYLVVWANDDYVGDIGPDIFGQRVSALGAEVGADDFQISQAGNSGGLGAHNPAIAYNPTNNEYLVVWDSDIGTSFANEIYGQRLLGATALETGTNDFRISGTAAEFEFDPDVAYNAIGNEYLVVWEGDRDPRGSESELEVYGRRVQAATGLPLGVNDFRISDMGADGNVNLHAFYPAVTHNPVANQYLVAWEGDDAVDGDYEIFAQRVDGATGLEIAPNDFKLSQTGAPGDVTMNAYSAAVAYSGSAGEYLVVWQADRLPGDPNEEESEIFGQRLSGATASPLGDSPLRLSDMGSDGDVQFDAYTPALAARGTNSEYLVTWWGDDNTAPLVDNEWEIFGQRYSTATPTAARLVSFTAQRTTGGVVVAWRTAFAADVLAFDVWRVSARGRRTRINRRFVTASARLRGAAYRVVDATRGWSSAARYELEEITADGSRSLAATVVALRPLGMATRGR